MFAFQKKDPSLKQKMKVKEIKKRTADQIFGYKKMFKDVPVPTTYQDILMREKVKRSRLRTKILEQKLMAASRKSQTYIPEDEAYLG